MLFNKLYVLITLAFFLILAPFLSLTFSQENFKYINHPGKGTDNSIFADINDTITGTWNYITPLSQPLFGVTSYYWADSSKVFLCGGSTDSGIAQTSCYFFNPSNNSYVAKSPLPSGRWSGKLVKVRDSLFLVGSVNNWNSPDGLIYRYHPGTNSWAVKQQMPSPNVHESAVCVWKDSLIVLIGGSTGGFIGATNMIRVYNPWTDSWRTSSSLFPQIITTAHSEIVYDSLIVILGGYGTTFLNTVYRGRLNFYPGDSLVITNLFLLGTGTPFGNGVYRVGGAKWGNVMLFGPALRNITTYNQVWGLTYYRDDSLKWTLFLPDIVDTAGNVPTIAVKQESDSVRFFLFGGFHYPNATASSVKFTFAVPPAIGITGIAGKIPESFRLYQNYPNPFNPVTKIRFDVPASGNGTNMYRVQIKVYDVLGREIVNIIDSRLNSGMYEVVWNASDLPGGVYFYELIADNFKNARKMVLIK